MSGEFTRFDVDVLRNFPEWVIKEHEALRFMGTGRPIGEWFAGLADRIEAHLTEVDRVCGPWPEVLRLRAAILDWYENRGIVFEDADHCSECRLASVAAKLLATKGEA
jgi:hypothetical protein